VVAAFGLDVPDETHGFLSLDGMFDSEEQIAAVVVELLDRLAEIVEKNVVGRHDVVECGSLEGDDVLLLLCR
jgi:hypothetical protein